MNVSFRGRVYAFIRSRAGSPKPEVLRSLIPLVLELNYISTASIYHRDVYKRGSHSKDSNLAVVTGEGARRIYSPTSKSSSTPVFKGLKTWDFEPPDPRSDLRKNFCRSNSPHSLPQAVCQGGLRTNHLERSAEFVADPCALILRYSEWLEYNLDDLLC